MHITVDIGNTFISVALSKKQEILHVFNLATAPRRTGAHYARVLKRNVNVKITEDVTSIALASVVPTLTVRFAKILKRLYKVTPLVVNYDTPLAIKLQVDDPQEVGADIIVAALATKSKYQVPAVVVDLGTANKYIYVDENGDFAGVVIKSGVELSFSALTNNAAKLRGFTFVTPNKVIGTNTIDALSSGVVYGTSAEITSIVALIEKEVDKKCQVIITGGSLNVVTNVLPKTFIQAPNLIHEGLLTLLVKE